MKNATFLPDGRVVNAAFVPVAVYQSGYRRMTKRLLDLGLIILALPLLLPVFAVLTVAAMCDGGSPFYVQERVGAAGRRFGCFKFRSMVPDADARLAGLLKRDARARDEWNRLQKLRNDPRITPLGRFLRATSLDELPQLINVLRGEMSLVGPRPFTPAEEQTYRRFGGWAYFELRPGLTGYWQVMARNRARFERRSLYDNRYFRRLSLGTDLRILFQTIGVVMKRTGC